MRNNKNKEIQHVQVSKIQFFIVMEHPIDTNKKDNDGNINFKNQRSTMATKVTMMTISDSGAVQVISTIHHVNSNANSKKNKEKD